MAKMLGIEVGGSGMKLTEAARVLESRRNYLRALLATNDPDASGMGFRAQEAAAIDEVLSALYDVERAPRSFGMGSKPRNYRYEIVGEKS